MSKPDAANRREGLENLPEQYTVSADTYEVTYNVVSPMRDGTRLRADVYLPKDQEGPFPTLVCRTPYDKSKKGVFRSMNTLSTRGTRSLRKICEADERLRVTGCHFSHPAGLTLRTVTTRSSGLLRKRGRTAKLALSATRTDHGDGGHSGLLDHRT